MTPARLFLPAPVIVTAAVTRPRGRSVLPTITSRRARTPPRLAPVAPCHRGPLLRLCPLLALSGHAASHRPLSALVPPRIWPAGAVEAPPRPSVSPQPPRARRAPGGARLAACRAGTPPGLRAATRLTHPHRGVAGGPLCHHCGAGWEQRPPRVPTVSTPPPLPPLACGARRDDLSGGTPYTGLRLAGGPSAAVADVEVHEAVSVAPRTANAPCRTPSPQP
jgi:hypothetical protein